MKKQTGYRPWVAKKAPLFNSALNATYIRVSALLPIIIISLLVGALTALASQHALPSLDVTSLTKTPTIIKSPVVVSKPITAPVKVEAAIVQPIAAPITVPSLPMTNPVTVPAIPMNNAPALTAKTIINAK